MDTTIQIRIDEKTKEDATAILNYLGLDMSTALRMFLKRVVTDNGLPLTMTAEPIRKEPSRKALYALEQLKKMPARDDISLDEINEVIREVRQEKMEITA